MQTLKAAYFDDHEVLSDATRSEIFKKFRHILISDEGDYAQFAVEDWERYAGEDSLLTPAAREEAKKAAALAREHGCRYIEIDDPGIE